MLETEPLFCFHHVNAYETAAAGGGGERVILDCLAMKDGVDFGANFGNLSAEFFQRSPWRTAFTRLSLDPARKMVRATLTVCCSVWHCAASHTQSGWERAASPFLRIHTPGLNVAGLQFVGPMAKKGPGALLSS